MALVTNDNMLRLNAGVAALIGLSELVDPGRTHDMFWKDAKVARSEPVVRWLGLLACCLSAQILAPTFSSDTKGKQVALKTAGLAWIAAGARNLMMVRSGHEKRFSVGVAAASFALAGVSLWQAFRRRKAAAATTTTTTTTAKK